MLHIWDASDLRHQYQQAKRLVRMLCEAADKHGLPRAYVVAVASRETGIQNIAGDHGHGKGVIQIDDRYHGEFLAKHPDWKTHPEPLIDYGVALLVGNVAWAKKHWPKYDAYKIGAAAYNAGQGGARMGIDDGDCDKRTRGANYGSDVKDRMLVFQQCLQAEAGGMP